MFHITDGSRSASIEDAAAWLSRHDVHANISTVDPDGDSADLIRKACEDIGASWCVMGAFGHSPMREAIFGGVTRSMLASSNLPLFLAH
jgi:nucleotide-binding universal stress UspA family protein